VVLVREETMPAALNCARLRGTPRDIIVRGRSSSSPILSLSLAMAPGRSLSLRDGREDRGGGAC